MHSFLDTTTYKEYFHHVAEAVDTLPSVLFCGVITRITGMKIEATGLSLPIHTVCKIIVSDSKSVHAEVVGFANDVTYLMAAECMDGIKRGCVVIPFTETYSASVGKELLGRVIDAEGNPIDSKGAIFTKELVPLTANSINPLLRRKIAEPLDVGIKAINALMTVGKGQRIGIFAGSGVGKSILLGMMTHFTKADVVVVGLIGERGREVKEFIEDILGELGLKKSIVVAAPADTSPLMRLNGAVRATAIAEYFRDQGKDVLLIIDSLTRIAQAQREISLSIGELPATKGFTPSVFAKLTQLVERAGNGCRVKGSITAFYTVLVEGDDHNDPIADHVRSVLDGHIVLSRQLADAGHYPAIDVEKSISRVMIAVVDADQLATAAKFKRLYSAYTQNRDLINVGMYQLGSDKTVDEAIKHKDAMEDFLRQGIHDSYDMESSLHKLINVFST